MKVGPAFGRVWLMGIGGQWFLGANDTAWLEQRFLNGPFTMLHPTTRETITLEGPVASLGPLPVVS